MTKTSLKCDDSSRPSKRTQKSTGEVYRKQEAARVCLGRIESLKLVIINLK